MHFSKMLFSHSKINSCRLIISAKGTGNDIDKYTKVLPIRDPKKPETRISVQYLLELPGIFEYFILNEISHQDQNYREINSIFICIEISAYELF